MTPAGLPGAGSPAGFGYASDARLPRYAYSLAPAAHRPQPDP
jgi:hypothetical protein